ncbi:sulfotransferase domain-containing protein [soil metagenome]
MDDSGPPKLHRRVAALERENAELRARLADAGSETNDVDPGNLVWIFGSGRSGSTWLAGMMGELEGFTLWNEPLVGTLFGDLYYVRGGDRIGKKGKHFILGGGYRESWLRPMRDLILSGAAARFPEVARGGYLIVKEPNGSVGAPLLMETLPESRMVLLVRDPRDVISSSMDAHQEGGWLYESNRQKGDPNRPSLPGKDPDAYVRLRAGMYVQSVGNARQAYEEHKGYKALVRYEDLRAEPLPEMRRIRSELGLPAEEDALEHAVERHSFEELPQENKGEGKFHRKASPGGWSEDLTPKQVRIIERITKPLLQEFYRA